GLIRSVWRKHIDFKWAETLVKTSLALSSVFCAPLSRNHGDRQSKDGELVSDKPLLCSHRTQCWDVALGPLKQIPMNLFIMYMSGNTISIFPIMMVCMMAWRPIQALMSMSASE
uniref:ER membrane protein complex subunit 4 n=1 Tax=Sinocyclocheilus anshuiensis TaxID=1608454 RepID=A0A671L993_9TELE